MSFNRVVNCAAILVAVVLFRSADAAPREDTLETDFLDGLQRVCIPAQVRGLTAKTYIENHDLNLQPMEISNRARERAWAVSTDRRVYILSTPDICQVSGALHTDPSAGFVARLHESLSTLSATEPQTLGSPADDEFVGSYCALLSNGMAASYQLQAVDVESAPEIGRLAPRKHQVVTIAVPRTSTCRTRE